ncbi:DNA replication protein [Listeria floridensis FSL S10-1187]|uniref:DNA replication protein n=1 Tax=Listeria floridensis FSL S10-1187 TaxID=1265817 RepID=A0ABN0RGI1_9LIST|nr:DNA replication protein [Listeria floridensis FSL S10-1187]
MNQNLLSEWLTEGTVSLPQVVVKNYAALQMNEQELVLVLQIESFRVSGNRFPSIAELAERMNFEQTAVMRLIESLTQKGILAIEQHQENRVLTERFSLAPLYHKLQAYFENQTLTEKVRQGEEEGIHIYRLFESEFGRPLSPLEAEMISGWLDHDHFPPELVREALKEAVIAQKKEFPLYRSNFAQLERQASKNG